MVRMGTAARVPRGFTALLWEADKLNPNAQVIKEILDKNPRSIYDRSGSSDYRETALHKCVRGGNERSLECVRILLAYRPDINALTDDVDEDADADLTPLDYAVQSDGDKTWEIIKLLVDEGAERNNPRESKYDYAIEEYIASKKRRNEIVYKQAYRGLAGPSPNGKRPAIPEAVLGLEINRFLRNIPHEERSIEFPERGAARRRKSRKGKGRKGKGRKGKSRKSKKN